LKVTFCTELEKKQNETSKTMENCFTTNTTTNQYQTNQLERNAQVNLQINSETYKRARFELYTQALVALYSKYKLVSIEEPYHDYWGHICTGACHFFEYPPLYVCTFSQNIHYCTSSECDQQVCDVSNSVCALTGQVFACDFATLSYTERADTTPEVTSKPVTKKRKHNVETQQLRNKYKNDSITSRKLDHVQDKRSKYHIHEALADTLLKALLPQPAQPEHIKQITKIALTLWQQFSTTATFIQYTFTYKFEYHILAILNEIDTGEEFRYKNKIIVPRIAALKDRIEFISRLTNRPFPVLIKYKLTSNGFTTSRKIFRECVEQCNLD
jgi:hypothetical protein